MSTPSSEQGGFFGAIIAFFKRLFGGDTSNDAHRNNVPPVVTPPNTETGGNINRPSDKIELPQTEPVVDTNDNSISVSPPDTKDQPKEEHLNDITIKYGDREITLSKSGRYIAVKPKDDIAVFDSTMSRNVRNVRFRGRRQGDFELLETNSGTVEEAERTLDNARALPSVEVGSHVYHIEQGEVPMIPSGEIYLVLHEQATEDDAQTLIQQYALHVTERRSPHEWILQVTEQSPNPIKVCVALQQSPLVKIAEPELESPVSTKSVELPADELLRDQWHLQNKGKHGDWPNNAFKAGADAKVIEAWQYMGSLGSNKITVAVIDSGFDTSHPDLRGDGTKIVAPWDFESDTPDPSPKTGDWHGTACAGVAVGAANNTGIVGAAPNAKLIPMRFSYISDTQIERWFEHCSKNGADVVSNSWGSADPNFVMSTRMIEAIRKCATQGRGGKGCVILFAAGNTNRDVANPADPNAIGGFPTHPNILAISASNSKDERSSYSNYGKYISVCAPSNGSGGAGVTTSDVTGTLPLPSGGFGYKGYDAGDYTTSFGGTSSACPLAAGVCALILSVKPELTAAQVKEILESTTDKIGSTSDYNAKGHSIHFGYGRINALKAVTKAKTGQIPAAGGNTTGGGTHGGNSGNNTTNNNNNTNNTPAPNPAPNVDADLIPFEGLRGGVLREGVIHYYKISITGKMRLRLESPTEEKNDFDMFLRKNGAPEPKTKKYDFLSTKDGSDEEIIVPNADQADYFVLLRSVFGNGGYNFENTLLCTSSDPNIEALPLSAMIGGFLVKDRIPHIFYRMSNRRKLEFILDSPVGENTRNFDMFVKRGALPSPTQFDHKSTNTGNNERITINTPAPGDYYIALRAAKGVGGYNLKVVLT